MSLRGHREPRARKRIPENLVRRNEGAHFVRTKFEPQVCKDCGGTGLAYDVANAGDHPVMCWSCEGTGEE
jgi:DnaJ-class molecular chaperone